MAFGFTCTHCGKSLELKDVLFRMNYLLHWKKENKDAPLTYLNLYVTEENLRTLLNNGTPSQEPGMTLCRISFVDICTLLANKNNFDIPNFKLSFQDLCLYLDHSGAEGNAQPEAPQQGAKEDDDAFAARLEQYEQEQEARKGQEEQYQKVLTMIQRIAYGSDGANISARDKEEREELLKTDLRLLREMYGIRKKVDTNDVNQENTEIIWEERTRYFQMSLWEKPSTKGDKVLLGYMVKAATAEGKGYGSGVDCLSHRVCPRCKGRVFEGAGMAIHRMAMFVGSTGTGKTSTILSMAHFAKNQNKGIWLNKKLDSVKDVRLISVGTQLETDLKNYELGFAPAKTNLQDDAAGSEAKAKEESKKEKNFAYSATLEIKGHREQRGFLTFMDAPGEVCNEESGKVEFSIIDDHFNAIITCDAYVLCFEDPVERDARIKNSGRTNKTAGDHKDMVIEWAQDIQQHRAKRRKDYKLSGDYAPMMVLFTKGRDIEEKDAREATARKGNNAVYYMYPEEIAAIRKRNDEWKEIVDNLSKDKALSQAYMAQLRCSPYGYTSPRNNATAEAQTPSPKNVDKLLNWLLYATGLAPMDLSDEHLGSANYMTPPENRSLLPDQKLVRDGGRGIPYTGSFFEKFKWRTEKPYMPAVAVAMLRGKLFTNIGEADRDYIRFMDDGIQMHDIWCRYHPRNKK